MDVVATVINALVVAAVGLVLAWISKDRFKALERRIDRLEDRMERFQGSLDGMRSDLTQVALAVGARPRASGSSS
jgi:biopolymer transport protein ExbB/TolQ